MKIILITLIAAFNLNIHGQKPSAEKVSLLLNLTNLEKSWEKIDKKEYQKLVRKSPIYKLVEVELTSYFNEVFSWEEIRKEATKYYQDNYTEAEMNKLIAIYELPVMKKHQSSQFGELRKKLRNFIQGRVRVDDPKFKKIKKLLKERYKKNKVKLKK